MVRGILGKIRGITTPLKNPTVDGNQNSGKFTSGFMVVGTHY